MMRSLLLTILLVLAVGCGGKDAGQKPSGKNGSPKTEPKKTEPKKTEPKKTEPKKTEPKKTEPKKTEPKKTEPKKTEPKKTEPKKTEPKKTENAGTISLIPVDKRGYDAEIAKHKGKVVLVDFWGTWCLPCKKSFPATVKYDALFREKGLVVISFAVEFEFNDEQKKAALDFLKQNKATFKNLIWKKAVNEAFNEFKYEGMPHFRIYDHTGKEQAALTGANVKEQLEAKFKDLLVQRSKALKVK